MSTENTQEMHHGFKKITEANWQKPDTVLSSFARLDTKTGAIVPVTGDEWTAEILRHQLSSNVPENVCTLFAIAQGTMVYGYFFYPLYSLGLHECSRVAETAISVQCKALGVPNSRKTYEKKIEWLKINGHLSSDQAELWHAFRDWRNMVSHQEQQTLMMPGQTIGMMSEFVRAINDLFE